jgi:hypothetical protein
MCNLCGGKRWRMAKAFPTLPRGAKACLGPFLNQIALKFGQRTHDMKNQSATSCRCIDPIG